MLAAALDQVTCEVESVEVEGEEFNPSCELLAMWLGDRLNVPVQRSLSGGPGLTAVRMTTDCGPIVLDRADGSLATLSIEGQPDRAVALKRRDTAELIAEELRRLDPDDTYASALRFGVERLNTSNGKGTKGGETPAVEPAADAQEPVAGPQEPGADAPEPVAKGEAVAVPAPVETAAKAPAKEATAQAPVKKAAAK
ncbi:Glucose-6-phosphate dehydrogenase assembly protein OpcA OS=Streptomyces aurantiogriseus OX=66870 GN=GCM10010251_79640 PE=4 SV=1 [Streptomyces aurantiogriseus]